MAAEWPPVMLSKVLSFSNGKSSPDRADGLPHPVYGSNGIIGFAKETNADPDTIVIGRVGSYCGSLYLSKHKCWVTDNAIRANAIDDNDARFLFYLLKTLGLNHWRAGSGQPLLNQTILGAIPVSVPEPIEQRAIAHILGTLDDKIELNRRLNETLEAMAQAIFKSWFVDFDPVPGLSPHKEWQDSLLGRIPKGWRVGTLQDMATVTSGKRPDCQPSNRTDYMRIPLYGGGGQMGYVEKALYQQPIITTGRVGTLGIVFRIPFPCWPSDNTLVVLSKDSEHFEFIYYQLRLIDLIVLNRGSTQPLLTQGDLNNQEVVIPQHRAVSIFHRAVNSLHQQIDSNENQSRILAAIRDVLLPKLLLGEIRVKDAEKFVEIGL